MTTPWVSALVAEAYGAKGRWRRANKTPLAPRLMASRTKWCQRGTAGRVSHWPDDVSPRQGMAVPHRVLTDNCPVPIERQCSSGGVEASPFPNRFATGPSTLAAPHSYTAPLIERCAQRLRRFWL